MIVFLKGYLFLYVLFGDFMKILGLKVMYFEGLFKKVNFKGLDSIMKIGS